MSYALFYFTNFLEEYHNFVLIVSSKKMPRGQGRAGAPGEAGS